MDSFEKEPPVDHPLMNYHKGLPDDDVSSIYDEDYKPAAHPLALVGSILCPFAWLCSCFVVREQTSVVQLHCGRFTSLFEGPGIHVSNPCGRTLRVISKRKQVIQIPASQVADLNGNPLKVSAIVTFYFHNSVKAAFAVQNPVEFVRSNATSVLQAIVSKYPYERRHGDDPADNNNHHHIHNLKTESTVVSQEAVAMLQQHVDVAGCKILSFAFNEISYSKEIASAMLKKQEAEIVVQARGTITRGAVDIADQAIQSLADQGIHLTPAEKSRVIGNLLYVTCGDGASAPNK